MIDIVGRAYSLCDQITRREMLRVGSLAVGGVTLAELFRQQALGSPSADLRSNRAVIQIFLGGGPSQLDMYDMKPHAPAEIRGEFKEIATSVPGIRICEHLPLQAAIMEKLAILRSVSHTNPSHLPSSHFVQTGYEPGPSLTNNQHPFVGSVVARERIARGDAELPPYVAVPRPIAFGRAAYLGSRYNPFTTEGDPSTDDYTVRNLQLAAGVDIPRVRSRVELLARLNTLRHDLDVQLKEAGIDRYTEDALALITSPQATRAFDLRQEDRATRDRYGRTMIGQNCLLARRLVEAGVSYVTCLSGGGWDTHANNFKELREISLPRYDRAVAALVSDLHERGLLDRVLVMSFGEFGRTPQINRDAGRDHWPGAMSVLLAGGGLRAGQVVGATDAQGAFPITNPYSPRSVLATMYRHMGVPYREVLHDADGRPFPVLPDGDPIAEL